MAEPIIIVKENPGTLRVEVLDANGNMVGCVACPTIPFDANSELSVDGEKVPGDKFKPKKNTPDGTCVKFKIFNAAGR
jgi:hypothetical protein